MFCSVLEEKAHVHDHNRGAAVFLGLQLSQDFPTLILVQAEDSREVSAATGYTSEYIQKRKCKSIGAEYHGFVFVSHVMISQDLAPGQTKNP